MQALKSARLRAIGLLVGLVGLGIAAGPALAVSAQFTAKVIQIDLDNGTGVFAGTALDDTLTVTFDYPADSSLAEIFTEPDTGTPIERDFGFEPPDPFGGVATHDTSNASATATKGSLNIINDGELGEDAAELNALPGLGLNLNETDLVDVWSISGLTADAFEMDPNPNDNDDTEILFDGVLFEAAILSTDTTTLSDVSYQTTPPELNNRIGLLLITEADASGIEIFAAVATLESAAVVPLPPSVLLLGSAGLLLALARRR